MKRKKRKEKNVFVACVQEEGMVCMKVCDVLEYITVIMYLCSLRVFICASFFLCLIFVTFVDV